MAMPRWIAMAILGFALEIIGKTQAGFKHFLTRTRVFLQP